MKQRVSARAVSNGRIRHVAVDVARSRDADPECDDSRRPRRWPFSAATLARGVSGAGFTLVEMLLAVTLLAVLVALALPAIREPIARARRSALQADLLEDAAYLHRYEAANGTFSGTPPPRLPLPSSPRSGTAAYAIAVAVPPDDPASFLLTATRAGAGAMAGDRCGDFTYDHLGRRGLVPGTAAAGVSVEACWR